MMANMEKSSTFIVGVDDDTKNKLLDITRFTIGAFPIRYLGLSLSSKKWNKLDCHQLTDRITQRIKYGYSKKLSYAERLQSINAVLFSIHNFWLTVFILPQSVLKEVDKLCGVV